MNSKSPAGLDVLLPGVTTGVYAILSLMLFTDPGGVFPVLAGLGALAVAAACAAVVVRGLRGRHVETSSHPGVLYFWMALASLGLAAGQAQVGGWPWGVLAFVITAAAAGGLALRERRARGGA